MQVDFDQFPNPSTLLAVPQPKLHPMSMISLERIMQDTAFRDHLATTSGKLEVLEGLRRVRCQDEPDSAWMPVPVVAITMSLRPYLCTR